METQSHFLPILSPETIKAIDLHLEDLYETKSTQIFGQQMVRAELNPSQIRGLENLVMSTRRFSEVINYIKNQAGKDRKGQWSQIVDDLLNQLYELEKKAKDIGQNDPATVLEVKKRLARGWVKQVVAHYLFKESHERGG